MSWVFTKIENHYAEPVTVCYSVEKNRTLEGMAPSVLGSAAVMVPYVGVLEFKDIGDQPLGPTHETWGVYITFGQRRWVYRYEGGGGIGVVIQEDGTVSLEGKHWPVHELSNTPAAPA